MRMMYRWSTQMADNVEKPKRVDRFIYNEDDVKHIFKLGDIGGVFGKKNESNVISLKKLMTYVKK